MTKRNVSGEKTLEGNGWIAVSRIWSDILTVDLAMAALDSPVVITVVVDRAVSVEEQSVLAVLERETAVGAKKEGSAVLRVGVSMDPIRVGARRGTEQGGSLGCEERRSTKRRTKTMGLYFF